METNYKIFVLENNKFNLSALKNFISNYDENIEFTHFKMNKINFRLIDSERPDVIFFNVDKLHAKDIKLLDRLSANEYKVVLTSYDPQEAIQAFNYDALGFLVKPFKQLQVFKILQKVISVIDFERKRESEKTEKDKNFIPVYLKTGIEIVKKDQIIYCKSSGKYTTFYLQDNRTVTSSTNIGVYENVLEERIFTRIHHSYIINLNYLTKVEKKSGIVCELENGIKLTVAARRIKEFTNVLKAKFRE